MFLLDSEQTRKNWQRVNVAQWNRPCSDSISLFYSKLPTQYCLWPPGLLSSQNLTSLLCGRRANEWNFTQNKEINILSVINNSALLLQQSEMKPARLATISYFRIKWLTNNDTFLINSRTIAMYLYYFRNVL